jgi:UDP-galactopyranose mutase
MCEREPLTKTQSVHLMSKGERVLIVGGGLTGCTVAHRLAQGGIESVILERDDKPGGLIRSEQLHGVLYEPHGSHIFHTEDEEVWKLANAMAPFRPYRHRVDINVQGKIFNWPPLLSEIGQLEDGERIKADLLERRRNPMDPEERARSANFEEWCLELMGPDLYNLFIRPYTEKQWGKPAKEMSAQWAPRRVSIRWDNDPYLFPDRFQGWPGTANGYTDLIDGLLSDDLITVRTGVDVTFNGLRALAAEEAAGPVVLTCPLDIFCGGHLGTLEWRGILVRNVHIPHVNLAQGAMVVNYPGHEYPFIRIHETKHASGQVCDGTVLGFEFTSAPTRYYPVEAPENKALNTAYQEYVRAEIGSERVFFAGRLANYVYIDMDDCMRQAIDCADAVAQSLTQSRRTVG